jgi:putative addiction module killer protein
VYYTKRGSTLIILLCGGDKTSQQADIAHALALASNL